MGLADGEPSQKSQEKIRRALAAAVHVFTGLGIVCGLLATLAVFEQAWEQVFLWLGIALVIDGVDGTLARRADVGSRIPRVSGERLDQVIDYVTYVFIPVLALLQSGILSGIGGLVLAALILLSSLFHFSDLGNKADDHCFVGFPAIWNIVAFYLFAFATPAWLTALAILLCVALTFVPMRWVHPVRVTSLWQITTVAVVIWAVAASYTIWTGFPATAIAQIALAVVGVYGVGLSLIWPWSSYETRD